MPDWPLVMFEQTFLQRHLLDAFCDAGSTNYRIELQSNFVSLVIRATADGMGISTLLRSIQEYEPGMVVILFKPAQTMSFTLCWWADEYLFFSNRRFVKFVQGIDLFEGIAARDKRAECTFWVPDGTVQLAATALAQRMPSACHYRGKT